MKTSLAIACLSILAAAGTAGAQSPALSGPITLEGSIVQVMWVDTSSEITVRDAEGLNRVVNTSDVAALLDAGGGREFMRPGTPITIQGYAAADGSRVYAEPAKITSKGQPLFPKAAAQPDLPAALSRVIAACGSASDPIKASRDRGDTDYGAAAIDAWKADCDAKLRVASPRLGAPVVHSVTTNSVIREGER